MKRLLSKLLTSKIILVIALQFSVISFAQTASISGTVTDSSGSPLAGASVKVKGSNKAVTTNDQGKFSLQNVESANPKLVVSYVGYSDKEINVSSGQESSLIIALIPARSYYLTATFKF